MSHAEMQLIQAQGVLLDERQRNIDTLNNKIVVMEKVIAAQREHVKLNSGVIDRLREQVSLLSRLDATALPAPAVNYLLYYQRFLMTDCHMEARDAHMAVVRMANEVFDLDGATPDSRFSDAQCVFWSLLPDSVRKAGLYLSTNPG